MSNKVKQIKDPRKKTSGTKDRKVDELATSKGSLANRLLKRRKMLEQGI